MPAGDPVSLLGWAGGMNAAADDATLDPNELAIAKNVIYDENGGLRARPGFKTYVRDSNSWTTAIDPTQLAIWNHTTNWTGSLAQITFVYHEGDDNDLYLKAITPSGLKSKVIALNTNGFTDTLITMNDILYVSVPSLGNVYQISEGSGGADPTVTTLTGWTEAADTTTTMPKFTVAMVAYERVFAVSTLKPSRLYFSEPLLPKTWTTTNYIDISPDDGEDIKGLWYFQGQILIFKENSVWALAGDDFESIDGLRLYNVSQNIGCQFQSTIVEIQGAVIFLDGYLGVHLFDGSVFHRISEKIDNLFENAQFSPTFLPVGYFDGRRYNLVNINGFPYTAASWDIARDAWSVWTGVPGVTAVYEDRLQGITVVGLLGGTLREMDEDTLTDAGTALDIIAETGWIIPEGPGVKYRLRQFEALLRGDSSTVVTMYNDLSGSPVATATLSNGGLRRTHNFNGFRWRTLKLKFDPAQTSTRWEMPRIRFETTSIPRTRGE